MPRVFSFLFCAICAATPQHSSADTDPLVRGGWEDWSSPHIVALYTNDQNGFCTGVIVASNVVLTAAHCPLERARLIRFDLTQPKPGDETGAWRKVVSFERAPQSLPRYYGADLAVVIFDGGLPKDVTPAQVVNGQNLTESKKLRITGYGINEHKLFGKKATADVSLLDPSCLSKDASLPKKKAAQFQCGTGLEFLAGDRMTQADACDGDSGGPIQIELKGDKRSNWGVVGVVSRSGAPDPKFLCGKQGTIYTLLEPYETWLLKHGIGPMRSHPRWLTNKYSMPDK